MLGIMVVVFGANVVEVGAAGGSLVVGFVVLVITRLSRYGP